jgi:uncharacterized protein YabE (DUF348 family)
LLFENHLHTLLSDLHLPDPRSLRKDREHQVVRPVVGLYLLVIGIGTGMHEIEKGTVIVIVIATERGIGRGREIEIETGIGIGNQSRLVLLSE